jgi:hypothetical protein
VTQAQDDQLHPGFVFFDLRAQVKALRVLDGQLVQTERFLTSSSSSPLGSNMPSHANPP